MSYLTVDEEHLAYGDYPPDSYDGQSYQAARDFVGDVWGRLKPAVLHEDHDQDPPNDALSYGSHSLFTPSQQRFLDTVDSSTTTHPRRKRKQSGMAFMFDKLSNAVHDIGNKIKEEVYGPQEVHAHTHASGECSDGAHGHDLHRFQSFAPQREGNDVKWYVDACGYMWAVSIALEMATESIWILDWWLSPELYLRRPPAKNEKYRIDRMLQAAAERGVKVNIIVYKEVSQALTRKYLTPKLPDYLHSILPNSTDPVTRQLTRLGLDVTFASLEELEKTNPLIEPPVSVSSEHTKHALEALHPNISVFRHPDHVPDQQAFEANLLEQFKGQTVTAANATKLPMEALKALYGMNEDTVLYWAHHEKLCIVDGKMAFMGGLDLCYGRWDTNQHGIADAHPGDMERIIYPGQDYNNARIMDFQDVAHWQDNKLDRKFNSRMGWSDLSICLSGPVVEDLRQHFCQRWNFIFHAKYDARKDDRYHTLHVPETRIGIVGHGFMGADGRASPAFSDRMMNRYELSRDHVTEAAEQVRGRMHGHHGGHTAAHDLGIPCQIMRSCAKWSHGTSIEHSIANAYIDVIRNSKHFIYIENQFFITATSDEQSPIKNRIGSAISERIIRAARNGEDYKMFVMMPAIPAFPGDLRSDDAISTRAIMEFQYNSINRGGYSIMETIAREGFDPMQYIRFFNLRSYDRINSSAAMQQAEQESGVSYDEARKGYDQHYGGVYNEHPQEGAEPSDEVSGGQYDQYQAYQKATENIGERQGLGGGRWDSVAECYMLGGEDIRNVPWENGEVDEIDAFVSEELYIHSKLLIADDRIVVCGSANLNDRSQLGDHDSEIAICIEDPHEIDSHMAGRPWRATRFAASLRRQIFRKHLGLLPPQDYTQQVQNFEPIGVPNEYDWDSNEDRAVTDPLSNDFLALWFGTARDNTEAFGRVFHPVPTDQCRTWDQYDQYFERFFKEGKDAEKDGKDTGKPSTWKWGHVVAEDFPGGVGEVKEVLSTIRGTLVEMPLLFLKDEDIAKEGLALNPFTAEVYT